MSMPTGKMAEALEGAQVDVDPSSFSPQAESLPPAAIRHEKDVSDLNVPLEKVDETNQDAPVEVGPGISSRLWTKEENEKLIARVNASGAKNWFVIAQAVPGRTGKSCRERWLYHLNPTVNKEPWTEGEKAILMKAQQTYGNKWAKIASLLPGRTSLAVKNHWYCSLRKKRCHGFQQQSEASPQIPRALGPACNEIPVSHCSNNGPALQLGSPKSPR